MSEYQTALDETPENAAFLSPLIFKFQIKKTPTLNFYVQNVNIPGVHLPAVESPNPFVKIPYPGDHIQYDDIMINFKVDENFTNWLEIYNWIKGLGYPNRFSEHAALTNPAVRLGEGLKSDISLIVMGSNRVPRFDVTFVDAFPVSVSSLIFDTTRTDVNYIDAAATFRYTSYEINQII